MTFVAASAADRASWCLLRLENFKGIKVLLPLVAQHEFVCSHGCDGAVWSVVLDVGLQEFVEGMYKSLQVRIHNQRSKA